MSNLESQRRAAPARAIAIATALFAAGLGSAAAQATECRPVNGHYTEQLLLPPAACASPVNVCIQGQYSGALRGEFTTVVSSFTPIAETPPTGAALFTADSTINARIGQREGQLFVKNAGTLRAIGAGEIVDLQVIVGGNGGLQGASGVLQAVGTFTFAAGGRSEYGGTVCLP